MQNLFICLVYIIVYFTIMKAGQDDHLYRCRHLIKGMTTFSSCSYHIPYFMTFLLDVICLFYYLNVLFLFFFLKAVGKLGPLEYIFNTASHHRVHHGKLLIRNSSLQSCRLDGMNILNEWSVCHFEL